MSRSHDNHHERRVEPRHVSDDNKMGIVLLIVALLAFGSYAAFFLVGFVMDLLHG